MVACCYVYGVVFVCGVLRVVVCVDCCVLFVGWCLLVVVCWSVRVGCWLLLVCVVCRALCFVALCVLLVCLCSLVCCLMCSFGICRKYCCSSCIVCRLLFVGCWCLAGGRCLRCVFLLIGGCWI